MAGETRRAAAFALARWLETGVFDPGAALPPGEGRAFSQDLLYTAVRRLGALRHVLRKFMARPPRGGLEAVLCIGAAQILYMSEVPDFAAVNETVEAAKTGCGRTAASVANAVLRKVAAAREALLAEIAAGPLHLRESLPRALAERWTRNFGAENAAALAALQNRPAETWLVRRDGAGVAFERLERGRRVEDVPGYADGGFIVQDPATRHAVELLAPRPGERILDACAAPGGKTVRICWSGAEVTACEVNPRRRHRLEENLARTRCAVSVVASLDGLPQFDKVLADVPCTGTGVIRRKPDIKWNWSRTRLEALVRLQGEILERCATLVAPGGRLVYSTCSLEPEENAQRAAAFAAAHPEFRLVAEARSLPFESGEDGAYAAAFDRA